MNKKDKLSDKEPKLSDKELAKWSKILGCEWIIRLYVENKIYLTPEQLDEVWAMNKGDSYERS